MDCVFHTNNLVDLKMDCWFYGPSSATGHYSAKAPGEVCVWFRNVSSDTNETFRFTGEKLYLTLTIPYEETNRASYTWTFTRSTNTAPINLKDLPPNPKPERRARVQ